MKWVCLMANMTVPGVGTLICKRWVSGAIQTVGSIIGFTLLGYCIYEFYHALQNYSASMDGEEEAEPLPPPVRPAGKIGCRRVRRLAAGVAHSAAVLEVRLLV